MSAVKQCDKAFKVAVTVTIIISIYFMYLAAYLYFLVLN